MLHANSWPDQFSELVEDLLETINRLAMKFKLTERTVRAEQFYRAYGLAAHEFKKEAARMMSLIAEMKNRWQSIKSQDGGRPPNWLNSAQIIHDNAKQLISLADLLVKLDEGKWEAQLCRVFNQQMIPLLQEILQAVSLIDISWTGRGGYPELKKALATFNL